MYNVGGLRSTAGGSPSAKAAASPVSPPPAVATSPRAADPVAATPRDATVATPPGSKYYSLEELKAGVTGIDTGHKVCVYTCIWQPISCIKYSHVFFAQYCIVCTFLHAYA